MSGNKLCVDTIGVLDNPLQHVHIFLSYFNLWSFYTENHFVVFLF